jgi:hypothetical protein
VCKSCMLWGRVDEFWVDGLALSTPLQRCVLVYLIITYLARKDALQTAMCTRQLIGRDVGRMIALYVYSTRNEAFVWIPSRWNHNMTS